MLVNKLKNHPFSVEAYFENSIVLTFAIPKEELMHLIPEYLELDTFQNTYGFIAVAMVQTKNLRPSSFPKFLGKDFYLIGYRVFVKYTTNSGKRLRGLYILKSETNKQSMAFAGNMFTHYNYSTTDINIKKIKEEITIFSDTSRFSFVYNDKDSEIDLPKETPFTSWKEARRFAGPLPFTFTYNKNKKEVLIIEGVRKNWKPQPLKINEYSFNFLDNFNFKSIQLANAFIINNIPYQWKKGKIELWN